MQLSFEEVKAKYLELCNEASRRKDKSGYFHAVGIAQGYMKGIIDFMGATEAGKIMTYAEIENSTVTGIPEFKKTVAHA